MSNQLQITGGAKVRSLEGVITGTSGVLSSVPLGGANGVATLDSGGKVPVSQLPSSVVTYLGTWDASTNTPTLTNGTGDAGDMYICNVAGTVNFGAGPITFAVGDWVLYGSGTWQKSNGQNGTVTSVGISTSANALTITNSPITTSGNIGVNFNGNSGQYVSGDGNLVTFPTIITQAQNLVTEVYNETGATLTKGTVVYINGGHGNLPTVTKAIATGDATSAQTYGVVRADITNNNNGYVTVIGNLDNMDTQAYPAGTQLYLSSTTAGAYTSVKQYAPAHLVYVGIVTRSHPTQGVIEVKIQNGFELDELHNVSAQTPSNNDGLFYNSSNSLWENKSIANVLGYTPADNSLVVHLAGSETITGTKTFTGNIITKGVIAQDGSIPAPAVGYTTIASNGSGLSIVTRPVSTTYENQFNFTVTANNTYTFPNKSGIVALTSDISYPVTSVFGRTGAVTAQSGDYTTTLVTEGTNLYFTDARARAAISLTTTGTSGAATYNSTTGVLNIPQYQAVLTNPVTGVGSSDKVAFWNSSSNITYDSNFYYSSSNKRLGVNTNIPNATIGANISIDSGYGLIVKNSDSNYNGIGIGIDSTYGNLIEAQKLGSAPQRNLTLLNNAGYVSVDGYGNLGVNILTPVPGPAGIGGTGIDIYSGSTTAASIGFHTIYSGTSSSVGAYLSLNSANSFILRNSSGAVVVRADGDLTLNTFGYENLKIDSTTGKIGIGAPASITERLTVNGSIRQTGSIGAIVKTDANGVFGNATASVDYVIPSDLSNYVPTARKLTINGVQYDLSNDRSWTVGNVTGSGGAGRVAFWDTTSNISNNALFVWDDVNYRMGIGLNNPQRKLEIYSPAADTHLRISGSAPSVSMGEAITGSIYQAKFGLATAMNQFVTGSVAGDFVINNQTGSTIWAYNSTEKMRLDTSGNLGIGGTATTNYRLQIFAPSPTLGIESTTTGNMFLRFSQTGTVKGSLYWINSDSTLYLSNNDAGIKFVTSAANPALTLASTGAATFSSSVRVNGGELTIYNGSSIAYAGVDTGNSYVYYGTNTANYGISFQASGERMIIKSNGNVGIGTSSLDAYASRFLQIHNTSGNSALRLTNNTTGSTKNDGFDIEMRSSDVYINARNTGFPMLFGTQDTERMRITSSGQIKGNNAFYRSFSAQTATDEGFVYSEQTSATALAGMWFENNFATASGVSVIFKSRTDAGTVTERMRITSGGKILVNTSSSSNTGLGDKTKHYVVGDGSINAAAAHGSMFVAAGTSTADTGISVNQGTSGMTMILIASINTSTGTSTNSAVYIVRFYFDGNNTPTATYVGGSSDFVTVGKSGSNTLTLTGSSSGNKSYAWFVNKFGDV